MNDEEKKLLKDIGFATLFILVFFGCVSILILISPEPSGIGGFVYQEIEWQEQTIRVIQENCRNGLYINDWERDGYLTLECYKEQCKGEYCKDVVWQTGTWTSLEDLK